MRSGEVIAKVHAHFRFVLDRSEPLARSEAYAVVGSVCEERTGCHTPSVVGSRREATGLEQLLDDEGYRL